MEAWLESSEDDGRILCEISWHARPHQFLTWKRLEFPSSNFASSSVAINAAGRLNVRTVSYFIEPDGAYTLRNNLVETRNFTSQWNGDELTWSGWEEVVPPANAKKRDDVIMGLEDIRLWGSTFTATTREYSYCEANRMVWGSYPDLNFKVLRPPQETSCEKNWIPIDDHKFIYSWYPLIVGKVGENDDFHLETIHETPHWFRHLRGSTPPVAVGDELWLLTHIVCPYAPRHYLHVWVSLDKNLRPVACSRPFFFMHRGIEYCLGLYCHGQELQCFVSIWDRESWVARVPIEEVKKVLKPC